MLAPLNPRLWSPTHAAHLLNRAGFGGTPEEIEALYSLGMKEAIESLLAGARNDMPPEEPPAYARPRNLQKERRERELLSKEEKLMQRRAAQKRDREAYLRFTGEWLRQMRESQTPLREKLALFWHGHFATSQVKVRQVFYLWTQRETFRRLALSDLSTMAKAMLRDPAMLVWLDGSNSRAGKPNENFAREAMELFILGEGNYTERDVAEAARAFTGYRINPVTQQFRFVPRQHDDREKTILGNRGCWRGEEVIDILCAQPACAEFMAWKFLRYFVGDEPSSAWRQAVAEALAGEKMATGPMLRRLFLSAAFYQERHRQIKAPVEWLVQCLKVLDMPQPPYDRMQNVLEQLGQALYRPPNVKGWEGGKSWITTSTLLARYNIAGKLLGIGGNLRGKGKKQRERRKGSPGLLSRIPERARSSEIDLVQYFASALFQEPCSGEALAAYCDSLKEKPLQSDAVQRQLLHLMMSTPEFQLI